MLLKRSHSRNGSQHFEKRSLRIRLKKSKKMNLRNIDLEVVVDNKAAIALYHKMGFSDVGVLKHYWFANNVYSDAIIMQKCLVDVG